MNDKTIEEGLKIPPPLNSISPSTAYSLNIVYMSTN